MKTYSVQRAVMKTYSITKLIVILIIGLWSVPALSQNVDDLILEAKQKLAQGQNANNSAEVMEARSMFERASADDTRKALALYYVALSDYRLAGINAEKDEQLKHLNDSIAQLEKVIEVDDSFTEGYALLGSALGWKTGLKPLQAMFIGPKSDRMVAKAKELQPENPRVIMIAAISDLNKPKMFGGDPERAMEGFLKAAILFEKEEVADPLMPAWGHEETYAWIGQAFMKKGAADQARAAYEKALEINPDYGWVKFILLPKVASTTTVY